MPEKNLDFDRIIDRRNTKSVKYDLAAKKGMPEDVLPLWVADMDFRVSSYIQEAIARQVEHGVFGYSDTGEEYFEAVKGWMKRHHGWDVEADWLVKPPGVVFALSLAVKAFTEPGDSVLIQQPVYYPFKRVVEVNGRRTISNTLVYENNKYFMDFEDFEEKIIREKIKLFILCNPHNPVGRVWTKEELSQIADICYESGTLIISDEIHADLTLPPYKHPTFALISEKARMNSLVFMSPSKAFNMPGLASSYVIIENEELRHRFQTYMEASEFNEGHLFAYLSVAAAYSHGTEWLEQVLTYIKENVDFTENYLKEHIPTIKMIRPQASYLIFLDCRELGLNQEELNRLFIEDAHLALNDGATFGKEGEGFMRLNIACPRATLECALKQLEQAVISLK